MKLASFFLQRVQCIFEIYLKYRKKRARKTKFTLVHFTASGQNIQGEAPIYGDNRTHPTTREGYITKKEMHFVHLFFGSESGARSHDLRIMNPTL